MKTSPIHKSETDPVRLTEKVRAYIYPITIYVKVTKIKTGICRNMLCPKCGRPVTTIATVVPKLWASQETFIILCIIGTASMARTLLEP